MSNTLLTIMFGLLASLAWGSGDFSGGLASRRTNSSSIVIASYAVGFALLVALALIWREPLPSVVDIGWSALAGVIGATGLIAFYQALATGRMGLTAPISAVLTAALPVLFSLLTQGLPSALQLAGFALALLAITLISRPVRSQGRPVGIGLALLAGCCFGVFFILISRVSHTSTFWPLVVARFVSVLYLFLLSRIRRQPVVLKRSIIPLVLLAGALDAMGNAFFLMATHTGRLDISAVLASLYPAATVLLASLVLRERFSRIQGIGVLLALIAVPLISV